MSEIRIKKSEIITVKTSESEIITVKTPESEIVTVKKRVETPESKTISPPHNNAPSLVRSVMFDSYKLTNIL